jgi:hypothetical protein
LLPSVISSGAAGGRRRAGGLKARNRLRCRSSVRDDGSSHELESGPALHGASTCTGGLTPPP